MKPKDTRKYAALNPFQQKDQLIQLASSHTERMVLNVERGIPNWLATTRAISF
jgi:aspartate 4-decarboxylase